MGQFLKINDTILYYEAAGVGHPVVFIHGFGLDTRMWSDQFTAFASKYLVICYDLRGFGRSALPDEKPYSHCDDLKALLDYLHIPSAAIVGLSMGGRVATEFAIMYPECVSHLVLVDSGLNGYINNGVLFGDIFARAPSIGPIAANRMWLEHPIFEPARQNADIAFRLSRMIHDYSGWHWINKDPLIIADPPDIDRLTEITAKTLVVVGEKDLPDYLETAEILTHHIPRAMKKTISGAGHMSNMEAPVLFNEAVMGFLAAS